MEKISRSLAYHLLFGPDKMDGHEAIDMIYNSLEPLYCDDCINAYMGGSSLRCNVWDGRVIDVDDFCSRGKARRKMENAISKEEI